MKLWMAPHGLHVEPGVIKDAETIGKLHAQGFYRGWPREEFESFLRDPDSPVYVAADSKRRIAGFMILRHAADEVELITIAVDPKWRKKGIGRAILRAGLADLMMSPARRMFLEVAEDNAGAVHLYKAEGFREVGRREGYYARASGGPATALVMARDLG